jgi:putative membrane protein
MTPASRIVPLGEGEPTGQALDGQGTPTLEAKGALNEHQIAQITSSAHSGAIDQARIAYSKASNKKVKALAQMMLADHAQLETAERTLYVELGLSPEDSPLATELGVQSGRALFDLRDAGNGSADRVYVDEQLAWLQKLEVALDEELIPSAREPRLKQLLGTFKERVSVELEKAREAEEGLSGAPHTRGSAANSSPVR